MSNFTKTIKDEISRLARKETKTALAPIRKPAGATRSTVADLKRRVATLEKETRRLSTLLATLSPLRPCASAGDNPPATSSKSWISGKGVRSLRQKLGLSQETFAKLVGVSPNTVNNWEHKPGMLQLQTSTKAAVFAVRHLRAREAKQKLAEKMPVKKAKKGSKTEKKTRLASMAKPKRAK